MKLRYLWAVALILSLFVLGSTLVQARSKYDVTTDYHGLDVPIGTSVTARAETTDSSIDRVRFRWLRPDETVALDHYITDHTEVETVYVFIDDYTPDEIGDWTLQVIFYDAGGTGYGSFEDKVAIRATSFNAIPEVPFGMIAIALGMFGVLGVFALKKKHNFFMRYL